MDVHRMFRGNAATKMIAVTLLMPMTGMAAVFPDVPDGHLYKEAVESLVNIQVVNVNPDGNFYPEREVNRAEMLKMLYRAMGRTPDAGKRLCFPDVQGGSWYES